MVVEFMSLFLGERVGYRRQDGAHDLLFLRLDEQQGTDFCPQSCAPEMRIIRFWRMGSGSQGKGIWKLSADGTGCPMRLPDGQITQITSFSLLRG